MTTRAIKQEIKPKKVLTPEMEAAKWKPGQSGNPSGRPKRKPITDQIEAVLAETNPRTKKVLAREVAEALIKQAKKGNAKAAALVLDRIEGKVPSSLELDAGDDAKITVVVDL